MEKRRLYFFIIIAAALAGLGVAVYNYRPVKWWQADRSSAGLAPSPADYKPAVVQVYAARTINWKGWFAVHSWIAVKPENAEYYTTYQVMGYRVFRGGNAVLIGRDVPDRRWFGAMPELIQDLRGEAAARAIPRIRELAENYYYQHTYQLWPGPNSNSFIAHIIRHTPELTVELPPTAIGKDWIDNGKLFALSESGSGLQFSLFGIFGVTVGLAEGIEIDILGLTFGIDFYRPALKVPFFGRIGMQDAPLPW